MASVRRVENEGVDFFAFLGGMVTALALIFLIWNQFAASPPDRNVASRDNGAVPKNSVDASEFAKVLDSADPVLMTQYLLEVEQDFDELPPPQRLKLDRERLQVARKLQSLDLTDSQYALAKEARLDSLSRIYGTIYILDQEDPDVAEELQQVATEYKSDGNSKLSRAADLALVKVEVFELIKSKPGPTVEGVTESLCDLLRKYPDDEFVIGTIRLLLDVFLHESEANAVATFRGMREQKTSFKTRAALKLIQDFSDKSLLREGQYQELFEQRWVNGSVGQQELLNQSIELLEETVDLGLILFINVDQVAQWFEREDRYGEATQIYEAMVASAKRQPNPTVVVEATKLAERGLRRNSLVGKTIQWSNRRTDGTILAQDEFLGRVVVVVYWSSRSRSSMDKLSELHQDTAAWKNKLISVIAVNADSASARSAKMVANRLDRFQFVIHDEADSNENSLFEHCPATIVPHAMVIDREGVVKDVNVPIQDVRVFAEGL